MPLLQIFDNVFVMDISMRELECFTALAEEQSFTRAARRLHLAQPALSRHIRSMEDKIGARLIERRPRISSLTPQGQRFYEESRGVLTQLTRAGEAARRSAMGEEARLRIGFVSAVLGKEIVGVLRRFRELCPAVQVVLQDLPPAAQLGMLAEGNLDGGFIGLAPERKPSGIRLIRWRNERLLLFVPTGHRVSGKKRVDLIELREEPFVAVLREAAPDFAILFHNLCRQAGFRPRIVLEAARAQAVAAMVAAGSGIAILPESLADFTGDSAVGIPLRRPASIDHVFAVSGPSATGILRTFLEILRQPPLP